MIRILFSGTVFCVFMFGILIGTAVVVGYGQPPSVAVQQLHLLDCPLPCWIGIVPGETPTDVATSRFMQVFGISGEFQPQTSNFDPGVYFRTALSLESSDSPIMIVLRFIDGITNRIVLQSPGSGTPVNIPSTGDIFNLLGAPSCVSLPSSGANYWTLFYQMPRGTLWVAVSARKAVRWSESIYFIYIHAYTPESETETCSSGTYPWRGLHRNLYPESP